MGEWVDVESLSTLERRRKLVVDVGDRQVAVFYVNGQVRALDNTCIHKQREIGKGVILGNRVVCPGHQWAFDLDTGFEEKKCRYQPVFETRVEDGRILVAAEPSAIPGQDDGEAADGPAA
jgi:nitrite reductase (NADH) small subunit